MAGQLLNATLDGMAGAGRTTQRTITQQLNDGIRSFDFRVAVFERNLIINHSLVGPTVADVVSQITSWLSSSSSTGELLFLSFSHPFSFNHAYSAQLRALLVSQLGAYAFKQTDVQHGGSLQDTSFGNIIANGTSSKVIIILDDPLIDGNPDPALWPSSSLNWLATGGDYNAKSSAQLFQSFQTDYAKAGTSPISMGTNISPTPDIVIKIGIQYMLNLYYLGVFKQEVYDYVNEALKECGFDYTITDDGDYDSLFGWEDQLGVFSGRYNAILGVQPVSTANRLFILATDFYEDTESGDMVSLAISYSTQ